MSKPFDYSKWDKIELSDDEDDCHPNIDKESWFRMKHRSRVEREETEEKDKVKLKAEVRVVDVMMRGACGQLVNPFSSSLNCSFFYNQRWKRPNIE